MEKSKLSKLFRELKQIAEEIGHSGMMLNHHSGHENLDPHKSSLSGLVKHFNNFLSIAKKKGFIEDEGLFKEISEDTSVSEIFVDAALISRYLKEDNRSRDEVHIQEIKIEEMENALRVKELKLEEQRLAKMEAELKIHQKELADGMKQYDIDVDLKGKE